MNEISRAAQLLKKGHLVAFPTETVYGLGADAANPAAIDAIFATKGRPATNPLIVHVADIEMARRLVAHWPGEAEVLAKKYWPGPLTLVLAKRVREGDKGTRGQRGKEKAGLKGRELFVPDNATAGLATVAIRVPNHPLALELIAEFDGPLAAPSANRSTRVSPTIAQHVRDEFPDSIAAGALAGEPMLILDGGACHVGIESTVLDLTGAEPTILRPGHVRSQDLEPLIGPVCMRIGAALVELPASSPGQHHIHYAPHTPTYRFDTPQRGLIHPKERGRSTGLVALSPLVVFKKYGPIIAMPNDPAQYAQHLYAVLRELDAMGLLAIYIEMPPDRPEWAAIRDRLMRATRPFPG